MGHISESFKDAVKSVIEGKEVEQLDEVFKYQQKLSHISVTPDWGKYGEEAGMSKGFGRDKDLSNDDEYNKAVKDANEYAKTLNIFVFLNSFSCE
jgi:hypothetical protein